MLLGSQRVGMGADVDIKFAMYMYSSCNDISIIIDYKAICMSGDYLGQNF